MRLPLSVPVLALTMFTVTACDTTTVTQQKEIDPAVPQQQMDAIEQRKKLEAENNTQIQDEEMSDSNQEEEVQAESKGVYTAYSDGIIGNGEESVLFFHATWCPACKQNNSNLISWYGAESFPRSVYKIDYDTAIELRKQFSITGQDTFIHIDGNGKEIQRVSFPTESALRALIQ